jgi:C1A family cysteine protease
MRNGKKVIKCPNSWGTDWGDKGYLYLDEDYFKSNNVYVPNVLLDQANLNIQSMLTTVKFKNSPNIYAKSLVSNRLYWIGGWSSYQEMLKAGWVKPFIEIQNLGDYEIVNKIFGFIE